MNAKRREEITIKGRDVINQLKKLVNEGNVRRIIVRSKAGKTIAEFPLTVGVIGAVVAPVLAAVAAILAFTTDCVVVIEK